MSEKKEVKRYAYSCKRCGWNFMSRKFAPDIKCCPYCKSTKWNRTDICPTCGSVKRKERKKDAKNA